MMPPEVEIIMTGLLALSTLCALRVGIPQLALMVRHRATWGKLQPFRLLWVLLMGAFVAGTGYRCLVWADLTFADQRWLGTIDRRWPADLAIAVLVFVACVWAAVLYEVTQREKS